MTYRIKECADKKDISIPQLSIKSGVADSRIRHILNGDSKDPRISTLVKLADALDVSLDELVGREFPKK